MPRRFVKPSAILSALPVTRYSTFETHTQRHANDLLRQSVERLWHPFTVGRHGADLKAYRFQEHLTDLCTPGNTFTCQVNGAAGGRRVLEDFFATMLAGFDIVHTSVEGTRGNVLADPKAVRHYSGYYVLEHTRPFLGWAPSPTSLRGPRPFANVQTSAGAAWEYSEEDTMETAAVPWMSTPFSFSDAPPAVRGAGRTSSTSSSVTAPERTRVTLHPSQLAAQQEQNISTLVVPFTTYVEGVVGTGRLSHLVLRTPVMELLGSRTECPEQVRQCLMSKDALKMFSTLRRAGVKPDMITAKTLLSASKQNEAWTQALGIL